MNIINLTPHSVSVITPTGTTITFPPSNKIARVSQTNTLSQFINGIPIYNTVYGTIENIPDTTPDTLLIVSSILKSLLPNRTDLISPTNLVRDHTGNIIGCKGFTI